ncbi:MAG: GIY-YIG nuclease family protein [Candidatus Micrarchaeaceae archaeon]
MIDVGGEVSNLYCHSRESGNPTLRDHRYFVYLLASAPYGTLYVGVTGNLAGRMAEHRESLREGFTKKYGVHQLVWFEEFADIYDAIRREKQIKKWNRSWKIELIEKMNPVWTDLFLQVV